MMKAVVAGLLCLAACCTAQNPGPCRSPEQFEGRILYTNRTERLGVYGKVSYDETNQRFRIIDEIEEGSTKDYYDALFLHNIGKEYRLNLKTRQCNVSTLTRPFRGFGVPPFAKFLFEAEIGAAGVPGESLIGQTFDGEFEDKSRFLVTVTYPDCVPVHFGHFTEGGVSDTEFFDLNLGISDPSVFIPPSECN